MTTKTKKIDYNSNENQEIKGRFVQREVLTCFSYEMEAVLRAGNEQTGKSEYPLPTYDDIENFYEYKCPECGYGTTDQDDFDGDAYPEGHDNEGHPHYKCPDCEADLQSLPEDTEPQEIYEWWIVTSHLYEKLKAKGQPVLEWGNNCYWGRCTTGQGILLDHVISKICEEMEILDGQKYSWGKK